MHTLTFKKVGVKILIPLQLSKPTAREVGHVLELEGMVSLPKNMLEADQKELWQYLKQQFKQFTPTFCTIQFSLNPNTKSLYPTCIILHASPLKWERLRGMLK